MKEASLNDYIQASKRRSGFPDQGYKTNLIGKGVGGVGKAVSTVGQAAGNVLKGVGNVAGKVIGGVGQALGSGGQSVPGTNVLQNLATGAGNIAGGTVKGVTGAAGQTAGTAGKALQGIASLRQDAAYQSKINKNQQKGTQSTNNTTGSQNPSYLTIPKTSINGNLGRNAPVMYTDRSGKSIKGDYGGEFVDLNGNKMVTILNPQYI